MTPQQKLEFAQDFVRGKTSVTLREFSKALREREKILAALERNKGLPPVWGPGVIPPEVWERMSQAEIDAVVEKSRRKL